MKKALMVSGIIVLILCGCVLNPYNYSAFHNIFNHGYSTHMSLNFVRGTSPKLEIATHVEEGTLRVTVTNPKGSDVFVTELQDDSMIQKSFDYIQGIWTVALKSVEGVGTFGIKFHDKSDFEGFSVP